MQVKKFEARTVKEALELVKNGLGPDAIILGVRDINNRFGLAGEGSVEVTAAVSEQTLRKKHFVESRMNHKDKESFNKAPARIQKEFINKMVENHTQKPEAANARKLTARPYIEITDEHHQHSQPHSYQPQQPYAGQQAAQKAVTYPAQARPQAPSRPNQGRNVSDMLSEIHEEVQQPISGVAMQRIKSAARDAWAAVQDEEAPPAKTPRTSESQAEIRALKAEISTLKQVIQEFRNIPQKFVSVHPGAEAGIPYELSFMYEKLSQAGVSGSNIQEILFEAQKHLSVLHVKNKALVEAWVANYLLNRIRVQPNPLSGRLHVFVGGGGQGKTATLVKIASALVVEQRKRVAVLTSDSFKVGAVEQLRIYSQILNVPFAVIRDRSDWDRVLAQLGGIDHILCDTPGLQLKDNHEIDLIKRLLPAEAPARVHLVLSSNLRDSDAFEMARRYQITHFNDVIFTGIDESVQHGLIYNFQKEFPVPLHSFGIGPKIPEDFEEATKERVLDMIFKLSKAERGVA